MRQLMQGYPLKEKTAQNGLESLSAAFIEVPKES